MEKSYKRLRRKIKIRKNVSGTAAKPRVSVFRSNSFVYAQVIDDVKGQTLASASGLKSKENLTKQSEKVGKKLADDMAKKKITEAVFDRNGFLYHGCVKKLAETLRENKIKI